MNWLIAAGCVILAISGLVAFVGLQLPRQHVVSRSRRFNVPVDAAWDVISDVLGAASWRTDLKAVESVDLDHWRDVPVKGRAILYKRVEAHAPWRLVIRIADRSLPYTGSWKLELSEDGKNAVWLTITENGEVANPILRLLSKYVFDQAKSIDQYLDALETKLAARNNLHS